MRPSARLASSAAIRRDCWSSADSAFLFVGASVGGYWLAQRLERPKPRKGRPTRASRISRPAATTPRPSPGRSAARSRKAEPQPSLAGAASRRGGEHASSRKQQTWRRNAVPFRDLASKPLIAIVIDDVGLDRPHSKRAWELPGPLTMSFLPYARDLREQAKAARRTARS